MNIFSENNKFLKIIKYYLYEELYKIILKVKVLI